MRSARVELFFAVLLAQENEGNSSVLLLGPSKVVFSALIAVAEP